MTRRAVLITTTTIAVIGAFVGGAMLGPNLFTATASAADTEPAAAVQTVQPLEAPPSADQLSAAFQSVAETVRPSVVSISSSRMIEGRSQRMPNPFFGSPFEDFFGNDFFDRFFPQPPAGRGFVQQGLGTGVIVSADGHILTNAHVVRDADEVRVRLHDDTEIDAEIVGLDTKTDLAVLKIDDDGLAPARLGDSDALSVGEWVVAIGNPFGLSSTITAGIVSAKGRSRVGLADYEDFIQTDAAINPGNSGGPLVNLRGEVVGINTAIATRSGGYMGIGFAIPINMARSIMTSLIEDGRVTRGWLGVVIQDLNEGLAESFGYDSSDGALVSEVTDDGPAAKAGLEPGDIIVSIGGDPVKDIDDLKLRVAQTRPGTEVEIEVYRDGRHKTLTVELGELESDDLTVGRENGGGKKLGMMLRTLTPDIARQIGEDPDLRGVLVAEVEPLSPAARAGIRVRDVITEVQGEPVSDVNDFKRLLRSHDLDRGVRLTVRSGGAQRFVFLSSGR